MIEITYGEYYQQANLAGKSVAEAREQYKDEFRIPSKAQAKLNDQWIKTKLEDETDLSDGDQLSFEVKKGSKKPILAMAMLLALALTAGSFAYGFDAGWVTIPAVTQPHFATVTTLAPVGVGNVSPNMWGNISTQNITNITRHVNYTGDLTMRVTLVNTAELSRSYEHFHIRFDIQVAGTTVASERLLTLLNSEVTFGLPPFTGARNYTVRVMDGNFRTLSTIEAINPSFHIEITPRR